jgi:hypothetical protein
VIATVPLRLNVSKTPTILLLTLRRYWKKKTLNLNYCIQRSKDVAEAPGEVNMSKEEAIAICPTRAEAFHRNVSTTRKEKGALQSGFGITCFVDSLPNQSHGQ